MQKTCKSDGCQRKFEKTSLSDLCPPCTHAFNTAKILYQRRMDNSTRQNSARSTTFDGNRDLGSPDSHSPLGAHSMSQPNPSTGPTPSLTPSPTPSTARPPPPPIDVNRLHDTFNNMQLGATPDNNVAMKDMYGMLLHLCSKSAESEQMKTVIKSNTHRHDRLEARAGGPDDIAIPLSITIRNLSMPGPGTSDLDLVKAVFREINASNVDPDRDIIKVVRQGATNENLGSVMVEMSSDDTRASLMKTKKVLETHNNPGLRKLIIKNMKSRLELKVDIALNEILKKMPGGEQCYVANNGHIREKNHRQSSSRSFFNPNSNHNSNNPNFQPIGPRSNLNFQPNPSVPTFPNQPQQSATLYQPSLNRIATPNQQSQINPNLLSQLSTLQNLFSMPPPTYQAPVNPTPHQPAATQASLFDSLINLDPSAAPVIRNSGVQGQPPLAPHAVVTGEDTLPTGHQVGEQSQVVHGEPAVVSQK